MLGRPSSYSDEIADLICARLTEGGSLRTTCKAEDMPYIRTVFVWLQKKRVFSTAYAREREIQGHVTSQYLAKIAGLVDGGKLKTLVGAALPLANAREAHFMLERLRPQPKGKIVLTVEAS